MWPPRPSSFPARRLVQPQCVAGTLNDLLGAALRLCSKLDLKKTRAALSLGRIFKMALLEIVKYGDPVLERPGDAVLEFDAGLKRLASDMFETMYSARGVGLAAPQIGVSKRLFV